MFDGKQIRDGILKDLADKVVMMEQKPILAEIVVGNDPVVLKYAELKKKLAEKVGITFNIYQFEADADQGEIIECIKFLNDDSETTGIMIQIPVPAQFDRDKLIATISPEKDVDGLRYCLGLDSNFRPPVVLAIIEALARSQNTNNQDTITKKYSNSNIQDLKNKKIALVGHGFLVGAPLEKALVEIGIHLEVINNNSTIKQPASPAIDSEVAQDRGAGRFDNYDVVISATGKAGIIKPDMVNEGVVLIDAGTAEESGELKGDIDPASYAKASYYTPVPGGIGPVTVAMLFSNLVSK